MTPEGKVKKSIKRVLDSFEEVYYFMPVQSGFGATGVDFHCVVKADYLISGIILKLPIAFFIEAKDEGKEPTGRQENFLRERREKQNCKTFVIDGDNASLQELVNWLESIETQNERARATGHIQIPV